MATVNSLSEVQSGRSSASVDAKGHQADEDGDAHQGGRGRRREKLPVLDLTVPQHGQHQHQQGHHEAAHVQCHLHLVRPLPRPCWCGRGTAGGVL